jgi:glycosyltransferase involved in cell wall biosynthesis
MASGLPVITPGHGGQADFLEDGVTGILVPEGRTDALAAALERAARDREALRRMGAGNLALAPTYFIERCAEAYEGLFRRVLPATGSTKSPAGR